MNRRIYRPGEVDDDAFGPPLPELPLPKWRPTPGAEQEQFTHWCLAKLAEVASEEELEAACRVLQADAEAEDMLRDLVEEPLYQQALALMPLLTRDVFRLYRHGPPSPANVQPDAGGRPADPKIAAARIDNARLTILFKLHFGQHRRPCRPSRLDILRARHELSEAQCKTLEGYLSKAK